MDTKTKPAGSFVKQAAILAIASLFVRFLGFLYRVPLTALIGDEGNGIYASGYYIYTFFLILSSAGLPAAISKMVSERAAQGKYEDAHNVFKVSMLVASVLGFLSAVILFFNAEALATYFGESRSMYSMLTLSPTLFIVAVMAVFRGYFQGMNTTVPTAISQIVEQILNAVFSVYLAYVLIDKGLEFAAAGGTAGTGIGALAGLVFIAGYYYLSARKSILRRARESANPPETREPKRLIAQTLVRTAVPIIIGTAIFSITNLVDLRMVMSRLLASGLPKSQATLLYGQLTGKYVVLTTLPVTFATSLATAVIPNIAASVVAGDSYNVKRKINLALRMTMLISIPAAVGIGVMGDQILRFLWPGVPGGGVLLQVGSISIIFLALAQITTGVLQGIGKVKIPVIAAFCGAVVKVILNYFLISIPSINVVGAVISTIGCYVVAGFIDFACLLHFTKVRPAYGDIFIKPLLSSLVMGVGCYASYHLLQYIGVGFRISTILAIVIAMALYFLYMFFLRGIKAEDVLMLPMGKKLLPLLQRVGLMPMGE